MPSNCGAANDPTDRGQLHPAHKLSLQRSSTLHLADVWLGSGRSISSLSLVDRMLR